MNQSTARISDKSGNLSDSPESLKCLNNSSSFFLEARFHFETAAKHSRGIKRFFKIAGRIVCLVFAGSSMQEKICRPLRHISFELDPAELELSDPENSDQTLTVFIWDSVSTQSSLLRPPWSKDQFTPLGQVIPCSHGRYRAVYEADGRLLSMIDLESNTAIYWAQDSNLIPFHVLATPLRAVFAAWFSMFGGEFVHAAAVGNDSGAVLIAGHGGAGKSSTAMSCLDGGLHYLSDDYCLVIESDIPVVCSVYSSAKVMSADVTMYPRLASANERIHCRQVNKDLFFLDQDSSFNCLPLKAILLPRINKHRTQLTLVPSRDAFLGLAESSARLFPYSPASSLRVFAKISRRIPAYVLDLGPDRKDALRAVLEVLTNSNTSR